MQRTDFELLAATSNAGKFQEIKTLLSVLPLSLLNLASFPAVLEIAETGSSFMENASLKASGYARQTGRWTMADDSGLEVKAIGGAPGIFSARYGEPNSDFGEKIAYLLREIGKTGSRDRSARFVAALACAAPDGRIIFSTIGICRGAIAETPSGGGGFGYDPVFVPQGFLQSFAELPPEVKNEISHRARALRKFIRYFADFMGVSLDQSV